MIWVAIVTSLVSSPTRGIGASAIAGWPSTYNLPAKSGWSWSAGNHRFVVALNDLPVESSGVVLVTFPWRRHDFDPAAKDAFIVAADSHIRVSQCTRVSVNNNNATFVFKVLIIPNSNHMSLRTYIHLACIAAPPRQTLDLDYIICITCRLLHAS